MSHQNKQGTVRPSLSKALAGATISRRYAAGRCADAQNTPLKRGNRTAPYDERAVTGEHVEIASRKLI